MHTFDVYCMSKTSTCNTQRTLFVGWRLSRTWRPLYVYTFALNALPVAALAGLDHGAMLGQRHKTWMSDSSAVGVNTCTCLFIVHYVHMSVITAHLLFRGHPDPFGWAAHAARARGDTLDWLPIRAGSCVPDWLPIRARSGGLDWLPVRAGFCVLDWPPARAGFCVRDWLPVRAGSCGLCRALARA